MLRRKSQTRLIRAVNECLITERIITGKSRKWKKAAVVTPVAAPLVTRQKILIQIAQALTPVGILPAKKKVTKNNKSLSIVKTKVMTGLSQKAQKKTKRKSQPKSIGTSIKIMM